MAKPLWVDVFGRTEGEETPTTPAEKPVQVAEVFKLKLPDGKSIKVDAPSRDAAIKAANQYWKKKGGSGERGETASPSGGGMASPPPAAPAPAPTEAASTEGGGISDYVP